MRNERRAFEPKVFDTDLRPMPAPVMGQTWDRETFGIVLAPVVLIIVGICTKVVVAGLVG